MKTNTITGVVAAALLIAVLAPATSSAQEGKVSAQADIEVITITAKRPVSTVANACVNAAIARSKVLAGTRHDGGNEEALGDRRTDMKEQQRDIRHCVEQAQSETRI